MKGAKIMQTQEAGNQEPEYLTATQIAQLHSAVYPAPRWDIIGGIR